MNKMIQVRKFFAILVIGMLVLTTSPSAFADLEVERHVSKDTDNKEETATTQDNSTQDTTVSASNENTGANSDNTAQSSTSTSTDVQSTNDATSTTTSDLTTQSGGNAADSNTGNGMVNSGNVSGDTTIVDQGNTNSTTPCSTCTTSGETSSSNSSTGAGSENTAEATQTDETAIENQNKFKISRHVSSEFSSGGNSASFNTGNGIVGSGNATGSTNLIALGNSNVNGGAIPVAVFDVYDNQTGDIDFSTMSDGGTICSFCTVSFGAESLNKNTGASSDNQAVSENNNSLTVSNTNDGYIANELTMDLLTGKNTTSYNTGSGMIETGDIKASANVLNFLNSNLFAANALVGIVNIYGDLIGDIILPDMTITEPQSPVFETFESSNTNTGAGSDNLADSSSDTRIEFENLNEAMIKNDVDVTAQTGANDASYNTGGGYIETGNADVKENMVNVANVNQTNGGSWWLVLVNRLGEWVGVIMGDPDSDGVASSDQSVSGTETDQGISASNAQTGAESENSAVSETNKDLSVTNTNTAYVSNDVDITAVTGENQASYNTGHGTIKTGDVLVGTNLLNFLNYNFIGTNWLVGIINVFGNWTGNVGTKEQLESLKDAKGGPEDVSDETYEEENRQDELNQEEIITIVQTGGREASHDTTGVTQSISSSNAMQQVLAVFSSKPEVKNASGSEDPDEEVLVFSSTDGNPTQGSRPYRNWAVILLTVIVLLGTGAWYLRRGKTLIRTYRLRFE